MNKAHSIEKSAIDTRRIVVTALGMALVCILTMAIKVPASGRRAMPTLEISRFFFLPLFRTAHRIFGRRRRLGYGRPLVGLRSLGTADTDY